MKRFFAIWAQYIRTALIRHMEFRAQFIGHVLLGCIWLIFMYVVAGIFFLQNDEIIGWSRDDVFLLITTWALIHEAFNAFFWSGLSRLAEHVTQGTFDTLLLRPVNPVWQLIFSRFEPAPFIEMLIYIVLLVYFLMQSHVQVTFFGMLFYIGLCLCALCIRLAVFLSMQALSFWFTNLENLKYLYYSITEMARYPTVVFKTAEVFFFTFLPIAYLGNVQTLFLVGRGSAFLLIATLVATLVFTVGAWKFFMWGARRYGSASS